MCFYNLTKTLIVIGEPLRDKILAMCQIITCGIGKCYTSDTEFIKENYIKWTWVVQIVLQTKDQLVELVSKEADFSGPISLAKKKREECVTDIHVLPEGEPGLCTLPAGSTLVEPEAEKKLEELEQEAKTVLPQV